MIKHSFWADLSDLARSIVFAFINFLMNTFSHKIERMRNDAKQSIWNNIYAGFYWFGCLSSGEDLFFLLTPGHVGISQVVQKKETRNRGWKEETDKHGLKTANSGRWSWHFSIYIYIYIYMFMSIMRNQWKSSTATKYVDSSLHLHFYLFLLIADFKK